MTKKEEDENDKGGSRSSCEKGDEKEGEGEKKRRRSKSSSRSSSPRYGYTIVTGVVRKQQ